MRHICSLLVIAEDSERLFLFANTLTRKFPNSIVQTCRDGNAATTIAQSVRLDAIIVHRASDLDEIPLVEHLRAITSAPIIAMVREHQAEAARVAGADRCLRPEQWLLVGSAVADLVRTRPDQNVS
jgi:DNA-binding response OmpR family regulator